MLCACLVQYYELAFLFYINYIVLGSTLLLVTFISAVLSTAKLHEIRLELFKSVDKHCMVPLVHNGRVRSNLDLCSKPASYSTLLLHVGCSDPAD